MLSRESSTTALSRGMWSVVVGLLFSAIAVPDIGAQIVYSLAGVDAPTTQPIVTAFRNALGPLNANVAGSFGSGRREINWDGVPDVSAAPNNLAGNFFNVSSPRGVVLSTPGTGLQVSANAGLATPTNFGNINPIYSNSFSPFSAQRLFSPIGSNITDVSFFVAGSTTAATTSAFGVVFSDVDLDNTTSLEFFDPSNNSLGLYYAIGIAGDKTFSFLGVQFTGGQRVSRVRITSGNQILTPATNTGDAVAMDDFIYAEPVASTVPEPGTVALFAFGLLAVGVTAKRRAKQFPR